jgi:hypothetical protein
VVEAELYSEYATLFRPVVLRNPRFRMPLEQCAEAAVNVALSTRIPMFIEQVTHLVCALDPVQLVVFKVFLEHLAETWFGIDNLLLHNMIRHVRTFIAKTRPSVNAIQPSFGRNEKESAHRSVSASEEGFGDVFAFWDSSMPL